MHALEIEEVRDNLTLLRGGGRTVRVNGVDLPNAGTTAEKLREITDKPVTTIINTVVWNE